MGEVIIMRVIGGCARGRVLKTRKGNEKRPTSDRVKESLFNILAGMVPGAHFLDVFAGNGGIGIEALSRGAATCVFIEKNSNCVKIIKENLLLTGLEARGRVIQREVDISLVELVKVEERFNIIFLDPPYYSPDLGLALCRIASGNLLAPEGLLVVEHHRQYKGWFTQEWLVKREKKYGDTVLSFLVPAAAGGCAYHRTEETNDEDSNLSRKL
jgi:16S rRNA (guanine(966)-N(2))-methyltransferase RsmD